MYLNALSYKWEPDNRVGVYLWQKHVLFAHKNVMQIQTNALLVVLVLMVKPANFRRYIFRLKAKIHP